MRREIVAEKESEYDAWHGEETLPAEIERPLPAPPPTLRQRAAGLRKRLPRPSEPRQKKALANILRFLALVLILTLVARGTAGATMAKVETQRPQSGEIVKRVRGTGTVDGAGTHTVEAPPGLTVKELAVTPGQKVAEGDLLAKLDPDEVEEELARQQAALADLEHKLKLLQRGETHDGSALQTAQRTLDRARQDYDAVVAATNSAVTNAQNALNQAETAANSAHDSLAGFEDQTSQEYQDAWNDWSNKAGEADARRSELAQAQTDAQTQVQQAARALEDAQAGYDSAAHADAEARKTEGDTATQNSIDATTAQLDIADKKDLVEDLETLQRAGSTLTADKAGTVQATPATGTKTDDATPFSLSTAEGGYQAEIWVDKKEAEKLAPGDTCEISPTDGGMYYHNVLEGTLTSVGTPGDDGRTKVTVRLPDGNWKAGQTVDVQVVQDKQNHTLCVSLSALHSDNKGYFVLVPQETSTVLGTELTATRVPVTVKAQDDTLAAIEGPLSDRDAVITTSSKAVKPGDKVRVTSS